MSKPKQPLGDRLYAGLLRLLPFDFRSEFGSEMEEVFREQRAETARDRGIGALLRIWATTIGDIFRMAPREHASVLAQDTRYALRMMRRNPGYTAAAVMILGLGIGVNTSIFSAVYNVLLKPLPYTRGDDLVVVRQPAAKLGAENLGFSAREIEDYRAQSHALSGLVEYHAMGFTLFGAHEAHRVRAGVVSAGFFDLFGVRPLLGRTFVESDDKPGALPVLVLSYEFWKQFEGGDPNIVGRTYKMNDRPHTVIGVLPPIPQYPDENDVYMPTMACPTRANPRFIANRDSRMMNVFARLKPGTPLEFCRRDVASIAGRLKQDYPASYPEKLGYSAQATLLRDDLTRRARPMLLALLGAAGIVLLIACANVANLMLARMARREQELVVRSAMGAGSGRLLRQLLTESLLLALLAAGAGVALAFGTTKLLADFSGQFTPRAREIAINGWVLGFAALCATATTMLFGSMAALYSRGDIGSGLKEGGRTTADRRRVIARGALIAAQVAFSFLLLIGAGLMVRSFIELERVDPGYVAQRVFAVRFNLNWSKYGEEKYRDVARRMVERAQTLPGVDSAAVASSFPMDATTIAQAGSLSLGLQVEGEPESASEATILKNYRIVTPDYFRMLGIPIVSGRAFRDSDRADARQVTIISRSLAARRWPHQDPIGRRIRIDARAPWMEIVGVAGDVKEWGPDRESPLELYAPHDQSPQPSVLMVRALADPTAMAGSLRRLILDIDPETAITRFKTLEQAREDSVASPRTLTRLFAGFAVLAFVIAVAGIGSMLALSVRQRRREIGIRMALGASPEKIVREVVRQGMVLVAIGLAVGVAAALELTRWMKALLFQVQPNDVRTFVAISVALVAAAWVACLLPARKAAGIDPQTALRAD